MASKVDQKVLWKTPGNQPNGLQATPEGLWVVDQIDPNVVFLLDYESGQERRRIDTRGHHSSGITLDPHGRIWIASTFSNELIALDRETGREVLAHKVPPFHKQTSGAHGIEWREGRLWFNVPPTGRIWAMEPESGQIVHSISAFGDRPHGLAWDPYDGMLWNVDTNKRVVFKLNPWSGELLDALGCSGPEPHGMTIWQGQFWLCDAATREVSVFDVPKP